MKHTVLYLSILSLLLCWACEKDMEVYNEEGNDRLNFYYTYLTWGDTLINSTFVFLPQEQTRDTVWFELETVGYVVNYPRAIAFEQIPVDTNSAVAGKHYVAFDDSELKEAYVVPANSSRARIPLIVLKTGEMDSVEFTLRLKIKENEYFKPGFTDYQVRTVKISNILTQPSRWDFYAEYYFAGEYSPEKYRFMIDVAAEIGVILDDTWFEEIMGEPGTTPDMGLTSYWKNFFQTALIEENEARAERGEAPLDFSF